jgi:hypothetical protein
MKFERAKDLKTVTIVMESVDSRHHVRGICDMVIFKFKRWPKAKPKCFTGENELTIDEIVAFLDAEKDEGLRVWPEPFRIVLDLTKKTHWDLLDDIETDAIMRKALRKEH